MTRLLKIAIWNANGLGRHVDEVKLFIQTHKLDILLVSETHFTTRSHITIPNYNIYRTNHPDATAHGGTAVIIRQNIKHYVRAEYALENLQSTSITIEDDTGETTFSAVYCPPKHNNKYDDYNTFFKKLGNRFIAGGDYNAKNLFWGSRLTTTKGRELHKVMKHNNLNCLSTGQPTYWPSDPNKIPDLVDICITKGIDTKKCSVESCLELTSDHTPILITMCAQILGKPKKPSLYSIKTDWNYFREILNKHIHLDIPLKTELDIEEAVENITKAIQNAAWQATPDIKEQNYHEKCPTIIKQKIAEKRQARKRWQITRSPTDKQKYHKLATELKQLLNCLKNDKIQEYLKGLTPTETTDYSLWKATRKIKRPIHQIPPIRINHNTWARTDTQKANAFAEHLTSVFQPFPSHLSATEEETINKELNIPHQMDFPLQKTRVSEIKHIIQEISPKKAPGYDLISGKILQELSLKSLKAITQIYNAILRTEYFPCQWKVAQIIMIAKPGKNPCDLTSYRPISLLPVLSKLIEKIILRRLMTIIIDRNLIPSHQFGFRKKHGTIEQAHRLVKKISNDLESKRYCSAAFIDISQAFDKVWHKGLLYKLKRALPHPAYVLLKSYLTDRTFQVKFQETHTTLYNIQSGVPQGSILGPILYSIFTADLPLTDQTMTATYADDTAILASDVNPSIASYKLQNHLNKLETWLKRWRIKANETKSTHVTFTLKRENCPAVTLNEKQIPQGDTAKYLGIHLDKRLTWKTHITNKRKQLGLRFHKMYWMLGKQSQMTIDNKLLLYKSILKPIWTYGIPLWGTACRSSIDILQRFQNNILRAIVNAPWYVPNKVLHADLKIPTIKDEITRLCIQYCNKLPTHPNEHASVLLDEEEHRRLKRFKTADLTTRFS